MFRSSERWLLGAYLIGAVLFSLTFAGGLGLSYLAQHQFTIELPIVALIAAVVIPSLPSLAGLLVSAARFRKNDQDGWLGALWLHGIGFFATEIILVVFALPLLIQRLAA